MKNIICLVCTLMIFSCSDKAIQENEEASASPVNKFINSFSQNQNKKSSNEASAATKKNEKFDPKRDADKNKDGIINSSDWARLSRTQRYKLVEYYTDLTYKSLGISPSKEVKEKEINAMISKLHYHYAGLKSYTSGEKNTDVYELMLSAK